MKFPFLYITPTFSSSYPRPYISFSPLPPSLVLPSQCLHPPVNPLFPFFFLIISRPPLSSSYSLPLSSFPLTLPFLPFLSFPPFSSHSLPFDFPLINASLPSSLLFPPSLLSSFPFWPSRIPKDDTLYKLSLQCA